MNNNIHSNQALMRAVMQGDVEKVRGLLSEDVDAGFVIFDSTPLMAACSLGNKEIVGILLEFTSSDHINMIAGSTTALLRAVSVRNQDIVKLLLAHEADPNVHAGGFDTPLLRAIDKGFSSIALALLEHCADPDVSVINTSTQILGPLREVVYRVPLMNAIKRLHDFSSKYNVDERNDMVTIIQALLVRGANPNCLGGGHETTYTMRLKEKYQELESLNESDDTQTMTDLRETPLSLAALNGMKDVIDMLIEHGALINPKNSEAMTALDAAVSTAQKEIVANFLARGAEINHHDKYGQTALFRGVEAVFFYDDDQRSWDCLDMLVQAGIEIDKQDKDGNTALMYMLDEFMYQDSIVPPWDRENKSIYRAIEYFKAIGASFELRNNEGKSARDIAREKGLSLWAFITVCEKIVHIRPLVLLQVKRVPAMSNYVCNNSRGRDRNLLFHAIREKDIASVKLLIEQGADPNMEVDGIVPLRMAIESDDTGIVQLLLEFGARADVRDQEPITLLLAALIRQVYPIIELLLRYEADPNEPGDANHTPLGCALGCAMNDKIMNLLLTYGAHPNQIDNKNMPTFPLNIAARYFDIGTIKKLISAGANPHLIDDSGETSLMAAVVGGRIDVVRYLIELGVSKDAVNNRGETALDYIYDEDENAHEIRKLLM